MSENIDIRVREDGSREVSRNIRDVGAAADEAVSRTERLTGTFREQMTNINNLNSSYQTATGSVRDFNQQMNQTSDSMQRATNNTQSFTQTFRDIAIGATVFDLVTTSVGNLIDRLLSIPAAALTAVKAILEVQAGADQLRIGLEAAAGGDKAQGARDFKFLNDTVNTLGLNLKATGDQFMKFQAAVAGTTLEGQRARDVFTAIAEAASTLHLNQQQVQGAFLALEQMASKGTVSMEELRRQLGNAIPGAFKLAAEAMGVTQAELAKMIQQGQVAAEDFLPKFGEAVHKHYGEAAVEASDAAQAALNRFETAWLQLKRTIVESGLGDAAKGQLSILTDMMNAVSEATNLARAQGKGLLGQAAAAFGAGMGATNPTQLFGYRFQSLQGMQQDLKAINVELEKGNLTWQQRSQLEFNASQYQKKILDYEKSMRDARPPGQADVRAVDQALAQQREREQNAANSRADSYINNGGKYLSKAQQHQKVLENLVKERDAALKGLVDGSERYQAVMDTYNARVANENEKYNKPMVAAASRELEQSLRQQLAQWQGYYTERETMLKTSITDLETLRNNGEISEKEFIQRRLDEQVKALTDEQAIAEKQAEIASGSKNIALKEKYLAEVTNINQKLVQVNSEAARDIAALQKRVDDATKSAVLNLQAFNEQLARTNENTLSGIGRGNQQYQDQSALNQINRYYDQQAKSVTKTASKAGLLDSDEYAADMKKIDDMRNEELRKEQDFFDRRKAMQQDWSNGAIQALENYQTQADNVASGVSSAFTTGFKSMEDSLVSFVTTGKLDFSSFISSLMADLIRLEIRILLSKALSSIFGMFAGSAFSASGPGVGAGGGLGGSYNVGDQSSYLGYSGTSMFASNATGGSTYPNQPTWVGENGKELWVPPGNGIIVPNDVLGKASKSSSANGVTLNTQVINNMGGQASVRTEQGQSANGAPTQRIIIDAIKSEIASDINSGRGDITKAISGTFGTNPKPRGG